MIDFAALKSAPHAQKSWKSWFRSERQADPGYWICMFISGTLGTVIGDFCSHNMGLDDAGASVLLSPIMAVLFLAGRGERLLFAAVLLAGRCFDQRRRNGSWGFHLRTQHARPVREHCGHGGLSSLPSWSSGGSSRDRRERSPSLPDEVRLAPQRHAAVGPRMALYRAVESRPVMAAGIMTRECVGRKSI